MIILPRRQTLKIRNRELFNNFPISLPIKIKITTRPNSKTITTIKPQLLLPLLIPFLLSLCLSLNNMIIKYIRKWIIFLLTTILNILNLSTFLLCLYFLLGFKFIIFLPLVSWWWLYHYVVLEFLWSSEDWLWELCWVVNAGGSANCWGFCFLHNDYILI